MLDLVHVVDPIKTFDLYGTITGNGVIETLSLNEGFGVALQRCRLSHNLSGIIEGQDLLKIHVQLAGRRVLQFQGQRETALNGAATVILMHDGGVSKLESLAAGDDVRSVTIMVERDRLQNYFDRESTALPSFLRPLITRQRTGPCLTITTPSAEESRIASTVIDHKRTGALRKMFIQAKVMELFCLVLDRFQESTERSTRLPRITERDRRQLSIVRDFLSSEYKSPPTIHSLCRQFGLNRNKLCSGFQLTYGLTIHEFCSTLRLNEARQMLAQTDLPLVDISLTAGYGSSSSFSTAFQRHYGEPPSKYRQGTFRRR